MSMLSSRIARHVRGEVDCVIRSLGSRDRRFCARVVDYALRVCVVSVTGRFVQRRGRNETGVRIDHGRVLFGRFINLLLTRVQRRRSTG